MKELELIDIILLPLVAFGILVLCKDLIDRIKWKKLQHKLNKLEKEFYCFEKERNKAIKLQDYERCCFLRDLKKDLIFRQKKLIEEVEEFIK